MIKHRFICMKKQIDEYAVQTVCWYGMKEKIFVSVICIMLLVISFFQLNISFSLPSIQSTELKAELQVKETLFFLPEYGEEPRQPKLYSLSACLIDASNGRPLFSKNENEIRAMASTTKIMTCLLTLERCNQDEIVTVSEYAAGMPDVQMNMIAGEQFRLGDLLLSLMLESHNDTAVAVAEHVGGSVDQFCELMTERARELGCVHTTFLTPNGLDHEEVTPEGSRVHSTTAYELALILSECIKNEEFRQICQTRNATISNTKGTRQYDLSNHNTLLQNMEGVIAGKTGFTCNAGYCYVGAVERNGTVYVAALLGCGWPNNKNYKWYDMNVLIDYAVKNFNQTNYRSAVTAESLPSRVKVTNGFQDGRIVPELQLAITEDTEFDREIMMNPNEAVRVVCEWQDNVMAPVVKGQELGSVYYYVGKRLVGKDRLTSAQEISKLSFSDYLNLCISRFFRQ